MKFITIIGARPQFIKAAPVARVLAERQVRHVLVHTGQHYDYEMSKIFFDELGLPSPDYHLGAGSGTHGEQTGKILQRVEIVLLQERPDWVLVYGDTNSTLAGALAAAKLHIPVAHIEAGLRSYNRHMPEEINRVLTDHLSTLLCCPTETAVANLRAEGFANIVNEGKLVSEEAAAAFAPQQAGRQGPWVVNTGDVMYDAFLLCREVAERRSTVLEDWGLEPGNYFLATVHRAENTDDRQALGNIVEAFLELSRRHRLIWPLHPRTRKALEYNGLMARLTAQAMDLQLLQPVGYFDMLLLEANAAVILTDSGGIQKEACFAGVPCVTLRKETEWLETVESGQNILAGVESESIIAKALHPVNPGLFLTPYGLGNAAHLIFELFLPYQDNYQTNLIL